MKKTGFISILIAVTLMTCGCGGGSTQGTAITLPLTVCATLRGSESPFTAEITDSEAVIRFDEEHLLSGTVLTFTPEGNRARVGDVLDREIKDGVFPAQETLVRAIRGLAEAGKIENEKKYTIDELTVMVYYDKDNDLLTAIETEESGRSFYFAIHSLIPQ